MGYQGWSNYATWRLYLHCCNECRYLNIMEYIHDADKVATDEDDADVIITRYLQSLIQDEASALIPSSRDCAYYDILQDAIASIDYRQLVRVLREDIGAGINLP